MDFPSTEGVKRGFDFFEGNWVAPHGSGKVTGLGFSDVSEIRLSEDLVISDTRLLKVSFPDYGNGIFSYPLEYNNQDSDFNFPYEAPTEGYKSAIYFKALGIGAIIQPGIIPPPLFPFAFG